MEVSIDRVLGDVERFVAYLHSATPSLRLSMRSGLASGSPRASSIKVRASFEA